MAQGGLPHYGAQKKYVSSQAEEGMIRVSVWIPKEERAKVLKYCRKIRTTASKKAAE
jgi:hypothetical protein